MSREPDKRSSEPPKLGNPEVLASIRSLLREAGMAFREIHHAPTLTSQDSARERGEELRFGGKALLMRIEEEFALFVLPADLKADSGIIRRELGARRMRFATREELFEKTGLVPGSVPPFGKPILPFPLYVDARIEGHPRIAFNAGMLTDSIILAIPDYLQVARPERMFPFAVEA